MNSTVDYLKDNITNLLFTVTLIEGIGCTFAQTEQIVERGECEGLDSNDITRMGGRKPNLFRVGRNAVRTIIVLAMRLRQCPTLEKHAHQVIK